MGLDSFIFPKKCTEKLLLMSLYNLSFKMLCIAVVGQILCYTCPKLMSLSLSRVAS